MAKQDGFEQKNSDDDKYVQINSSIENWLHWWQMFVYKCEDNDKVCSSPAGCRPTAALPESLEPVRNTRSGKYVEGYLKEKSSADDSILILVRFKRANKATANCGSKVIVIMAE